MAAGFSEHCCDLKSLPIRKGTTQEIADVVLFLASAQASFVQGASWIVDGGYTIF
jgi:NAD(P)-dependent dehydrogenase (short-subunit alcohol dehydrogenase family)